MQPHPSRLHHEELDAYQAAIRFVALSLQIIQSFPRGNASTADQLKRAAMSIPLNIAEGYGKRSSAERRRFFDIARGSAHECGALLDVGQVLGIVDEDRFEEGKELLHRIVSMLVGMVR